MKGGKLKLFLENLENTAPIKIFGICLIMIGMYVWLTTFLTIHQSVLIILLFIAIVIIVALWKTICKNPAVIPIMFDESSEGAERLFNDFIMKSGIHNHFKRVNDYITSRLYFYPSSNPRNSKDIMDWNKAWNELLKPWESMDEELNGKHIAVDGREYNIFPHVILPLSFALGASIGLRCPLKLYHFQNKNYYCVLKIPSRDALFPEKLPSISPPDIIPEKFSKSKNKLILHIFVSERHKSEINFDAHPDHENADNIALYYSALKPDKDWLPYLQWIVKKINDELAVKYDKIDVCLAVPSVIAFALGMAFSRKSRITVCHWTGNEYLPVFSLESIEKEYPLDKEKKRLPFT